MSLVDHVNNVVIVPISILSFMYKQHILILFYMDIACNDEYTHGPLLH